MRRVAELEQQVFTLRQQLRAQDEERQHTRRPTGHAVRPFQTKCVARLRHAFLVSFPFSPLLSRSFSTQSASSLLQRLEAGPHARVPEPDREAERARDASELAHRLVQLAPHESQTHAQPSTQPYGYAPVAHACSAAPHVCQPSFVCRCASASPALNSAFMQQAATRDTHNDRAARSRSADHASWLDSAPERQLRQAYAPLAEGRFPHAHATGSRLRP